MDNPPFLDCLPIENGDFPSCSKLLILWFFATHAYTPTVVSHPAMQAAAPKMEPEELFSWGHELKIAQVGLQVLLMVEGNSHSGKE